MFRARWVSAWVLMAAVAAVAAPPGAAGQADVVRALERELARDVVDDSVGAIAAAVFRGDRVVWRGAFGWADREAGSLARSSTVFRAGSITKTVTGVLLLRLVAEGVVGLDDPAGRYLPELAAVDPEGRITLRRLATHRAGLAREPSRAGYGHGHYRKWRRKVQKAIAATDRPVEPGTFTYSNIGYGVLGLALERAAGEPFEALVLSRVLEPLGMRSTGFRPDSEGAGRLAVGWVNRPGEAPDPRVPRGEHEGRGYRVPGEGLYSTVGDLARLGMAVAGTIPLLPDSLRAVLLAGEADAGGGPRAAGKVAVGGGLGSDYGVGVRILELGGLRLVGHGGTVPGYGAYLLVDPEARTGVVLLRSYNFGETNLAAVATRTLLDLREGS